MAVGAAPTWDDVGYEATNISVEGAPTGWIGYGVSAGFAVRWCVPARRGVPPVDPNGCARLRLE